MIYTIAGDDTMEKREGHIIVGKAGGTAGKDAKTYKVSLPSAWLHGMELTGGDRRIELTFDGQRIILAPRWTSMEPAPGHRVVRLKYYDGQQLCSTVLADYTDQLVWAENCCADPVKTAFGRNAAPTWRDYETFLAERCMPQARAGLREYLEAIGVSEYDPLAIIRKTAGRMAEDDQWLTVEDLA